MNRHLQNALKNLELLFEIAARQGLDYLNNISERPTSTIGSIQTKDKLSADGVGALDALNIFNEKFESLIVAASGPRYWGLASGLHL